MKDPVGTYIARAKRGMTDREIRWEVEDFQKAGLMNDLPDGLAPEVYKNMREREQRCYLAALTEAFSLSAAQKKVAAERLRGLADDSYQQAVKNPVLRDLFPGGVFGKTPDLAMLPSPLNWLLDGNMGISSEAYAPWKLCDLDKEQVSLTMLAWLENHHREQVKWAARGIVTPDDFSGAWVKAGAEGPRMVLDPVSRLPAAPDEGRYAGDIDIVPNTADQKLPPGDSSELAAARKCQPAQLRIALLINPELAAKLLGQLDSPQPPIATPPQPTPDSAR